MKPTYEQQAIYDAGSSLKASDNIKVIAFAGAGKTTTLKGLASAKPERGVYLAFNKANADEAKRRLALTRCTASSFHGLAYGVTREYMGAPAQQSARSVRESGVLRRFHLPRVEGWHEFRIASAVGRTIAAFSNSDDSEFGPHHGAEAVIAAVGDPDFIKNPIKREAAAEAVRKLAAPLAEIAAAYWVHEMEAGNLSHDMYLKMIDLDPDLRNQAFGMFRYLMVDEAQDINPVQRSIITKTGLPIVAVGDPFQQIYSWRGAENALGLLPGRELYLTQSFRFGEEIAEIARHILSIRPDGGPVQRLEGAGSGDISKAEGSRVAIICRSNFGVLDEALKMMDKGMKLHVDNIGGLVADVRSAQAIFEGRIGDVKSEDLKQFDDWEQVKMEAEEGEPALARLVKIIEGGRAPQIEALSQHQSNRPDAGSVTVCTAHRAKGMEWPAVQLGGDWKDVREMARRLKKADQLSEKHKTLALEEYNTLYVAATRPIARLRGQDRILFPKIEEDPEMRAEPQHEGRDEVLQPA